jgi:hypothetical protein
MENAIVEINRVEHFTHGEVNCPKCGKQRRLYWNQGRLDSTICCNYIFKGIVKQYDLVIYDADLLKTISTSLAKKPDIDLACQK